MLLILSSAVHCLASNILQIFQTVPFTGALFFLSNLVAFFTNAWMFWCSLFCNIRVTFHLLHICVCNFVCVCVCSHRSGHLGNWRKTVTSSYQVIVRDRLILPLTSTSCYLDSTNTCSPIATSIPALRYTTDMYTQSSAVL